MGVRVCSGQYGCGKEKPLTEEYFYLNKKTNHFDITCKDCRSKKAKENHLLNKERDNSLSKKWRNTHKEEIQKYDNKHKEERKKQNREWHNSEVGRNKSYRIIGYKINGQPFTVQDYNKLWQQQDGKCIICEAELIEGRFTHVDHDHKTGNVRGLLCRHCNLILGHSKESISILTSIINYLLIFQDWKKENLEN